MGAIGSGGQNQARVALRGCSSFAWPGGLHVLATAPGEPAPINRTTGIYFTGGMRLWACTVNGTGSTRSTRCRRRVRKHISSRSCLAEGGISDQSRPSSIRCRHNAGWAEGFCHGRRSRKRTQPSLPRPRDPGSSGADRSCHRPARTAYRCRPWPAGGSRDPGW